MANIEEITRKIDIELIKQNKNYLTLGQANKMLFEKEIISEFEKNNGFLKGLLENKKIKHAKRTESSPRQWRIFSSNKNWKKNTTSSKQTAARTNSEVRRKNKAKARGKNKEWNISGKEITIGVIILMIIGFFILDNGKSDSILAYNVATEYVKINLRSPSTAEFPGTFEKKDHIISVGENIYIINSWVDSQNGFGAIGRSRWSCKVIVNGDQIEVENLRVQ